MPVFLCQWPGRASLLVDDVSEDAAREVAIAESDDGAPPTRIVQLPPRILVAEVAEDDEGLTVLDPLEHCADVLDAYDDDEGDEGGASCLAEADASSASGDRVVTCELGAGHAGAHVAHVDGVRVAWTDVDAGELAANQ